MRKMSCRTRRYVPFATFGHLLAATAVPGSSESFATLVVAGAATSSKR
jgi:hypothetical protein